MRLYVGLPKQFGRVVNIIVYLINKSPKVPLYECLPEEAWSHKDINLSHPKVFSSSLYVNINAGPKSNLNPKFIK